MIEQLAGSLYNRFFARWDAHLASGGRPDESHPIWRAILCCDRAMEYCEESPEVPPRLP